MGHNSVHVVIICHMYLVETTMVGPKPLRADGTAWMTVRESRTPPGTLFLRQQNRNPPL
jgi:hypothetical protein